MKPIRTLACALALAWCALPAAAADDSVALNFVNADIDSVVKAISLATGRNFALDPRVKGTVNIVSAKPVPRNVAYDILLAALRMQGYTAVEANGLIRIVPEADAKTLQVPVTKEKVDPAGGDRLVTRVFSLRFASAAQLSTVLRPMVAPNNLVSATPGGNMLIVTDYAANLKRIEAVIEAVDQPEGDKPIAVQLQHANALDLAQTINRLMTEGGGPTDPAQKVSIVPDGRTNTLLIRSESPGRLARVRDLAASMDQPGAATGNIHVVYLRNAEAAKLAQTLRAVLSSSSTGGAAGGADLGLNTAVAAAITPSVNTTNTAGAVPSFAASSSSAGLAANSMIQADVATNALIITAPEPIYRGLRQVIDLLDKRRAQVFIEALIVELTADRASELGVQWQDLATSGSSSIVGGTNFGSGGQNIMGVLQNIATSGKTGANPIAAGLNIGILAGKIGNTSTPNLALLARALETDAKTNILSAPNLVTLDNEEAKIVIGQNVPFITGQYAQTGNTATASPFQTIERKDVGITLKIKPQISEGGSVRLQIFQEVSSLQASTISNASGPVTNKRTIESAVLIDDGGVIVLGGLIEDTYTAGRDKVPLLGDVPGVGGLFRYDTRDRTKTSLMVFLRPKILRDAASTQAFSSERYDYIMGEQVKQQGEANLMRDEPPTPALPSLPPAKKAPELPPVR